MDSQIGPDIAKLLGNLVKSTVSSPKADSNSEAGTAFKRALAASEEARMQAATGKQLPAASVTQQASSTNSPPAAAPTPNEAVAEQAMTTAPLPGFDLLVVGDPVEQSAILKFAQASGLSQAAVAELFSAGANSSAPEGALAQAVANWMAANHGAEGTDSSESMAEDINAAIVTLFAGGADNDKASLSKLANAVAEEIQPVIDRWRALSDSAAASAGALAQQLKAAIQPVAAQWMADHPAIAATTGVSEEKLVAGLVEIVTPAPTSAVAAGLESVVSRWLEQTSQFDKSAVSAQWLRDLSGSVMPDMAKWLAACALFSFLGWFRAHFGHARASRTAVSLDRGIKIMTFTESTNNVDICRCWDQFRIHFGTIWDSVGSCREALGPGWPACCCLLAVAGQLGWLAGAQDFGTPENGG